MNEFSKKTDEDLKEISKAEREILFEYLEINQLDQDFDNMLELKSNIR